MVLGAALGEAVLGRQLGNRALLWGAVVGSLPDLDVLPACFLNTMHALWLHRGPTHSLILWGLIAYFLSPWLARRWKREKVTRVRAGCFILLLAGAHIGIDCLSVYGTAAAWPLSSERLAMNQLSIVDPGVTLPLLISVLWLAFLRNKKQAARRRKIHVWGLGVAASYILLSGGLKWVATQGFDADLQRRGVACERRMIAPTLMNTLLWRAVMDCGDSFWVGYRSVFDRRTTPTRWTLYPKSTASLDPWNHLPEVKAVKSFSQGWWIARPHATGVWIGDLRFGEDRRWGDKKGRVDSRLIFAWDVLTTARGDRLRPVSHGGSRSTATLIHAAKRVLGNHEAWEGSPRLAGITGRLPETLGVE